MCARARARVCVYVRARVCKCVCARACVYVPKRVLFFYRFRNVYSRLQICSLLRNGWTEIMDAEQLAPFAFSNEEMVTYDNTDSIVSKVGSLSLSLFAFLFSLTSSSACDRPLQQLVP